MQQGHPEGNSGYTTIILVTVTENSVVLLVEKKGSDW